MGSARPPVRIAEGDEFVLLGAVEIAPGSLLQLQPGDVGRVLRVMETTCAASFFGATVIVPLDRIQPIRG